jgi:hypothetical protein
MNKVRIAFFNDGEVWSDEVLISHYKTIENIKEEIDLTFPEYNHMDYVAEVITGNEAIRYLVKR